jgi:hypothetical protein
MRLTVLGLLLLSATSAFARDALARVITIDPTLAALVDEGRARSTTFRDLIVALEASGWIVFVQPGSCPDRAVIGCLMHLVGTFEGRRYVRLLVNPQGHHPDRVITILAHELQHAHEVATAGTVTDAMTMLELQKRIASSRVRVSKAVIYETAAARRVEDAVFRDLRDR